MISPRSIRLDASTLCQLACPSCPTGTGELADTIGSGFLRFEDFRAFLEKNPLIETIELSNWGEVFLNPELLHIIKHAHERHIKLSIRNGVNLNHAGPEVLEALVKYQIEVITCSIDGATQETYEKYRVNGRLDNVLSNIEKINLFKQQHNSVLPRLVWQFVVFGHNEHEIDHARAMAQERNMEFKPKLNFDDLYDKPVSPAQNVERLRAIFGSADRTEHMEKTRRPFLDGSCKMLWSLPQINYDGEVLGCCVNHWGSFGNAFKDDFLDVLNGEKMTYARSMLKGEVEERDDIACSSCKVYSQRKKYSAWVELPE